LGGMLQLAKRYGYIAELPEPPPIVRRFEEGLACSWEQMTHSLAVAHSWDDADALAPAARAARWVLPRGGRRAPSFIR